MQNRIPVARKDRAPLPDFTPVPRKSMRHDGWTPDRQRAFIEALADTGSVSRACAQVNMSSEGAYYLRRQAGAESFRRAWEAALDFGVQRLKDIAFDRAIEGSLVPVFVAGKLKGYRRVYNDRLLMFCLRHYGQDSQGRRVTVNYFSNKATAGAAATSNPLLEGEGDRPQGGGAVLATNATAPAPATTALAEATTTTIRTTITGPEGGPASRAARDDELADVLTSFEGVELDEAARAEILRSLAACAERARTASPLDSLEEPWIDLQDAAGHVDMFDCVGTLESPMRATYFEPFTEDEFPWRSYGEDQPAWFTEWEDRQAEGKAIEAESVPLAIEERAHTDSDSPDSDTTG